MALRAIWTASIGAAVGLRLWNALAGPVLHGYDGWAHIAYVLFIDLYHAIPYPDQGWSYFHPPLYYLLNFAKTQGSDGFDRWLKEQQADEGRTVLAQLAQQEEEVGHVPASRGSIRP